MSMAIESVAEEMNHRIIKELEFYDGKVPREVGLAWGGYVGALLEWNLISVKEFDALNDILPKLESDPNVSISIGEPGYHLKHK